MLGKLLYQVRTTFGHGLSTAWYRDVVRKRILQTQPVIADDVSVCEIHVLTSKSDWLNLIWALKSFYHASGRRYGLCIHDDGSLTDSSLGTLRQHFPAARIIDRAQADTDVLASLADLPRCQEFRSSNHLAPKVFDFYHYLTSERMLLLDSDVLFFAEPTELLRRIEDSQYTKNSVNGDVASAYTTTPQQVADQLGFDLIDRFNSGLGLIHKASLNPDRVEKFLGLPDIVGHFWRIEQTLYALCSCQFGCELLPDSYSVFLEGAVGDRSSRHYVGPIRQMMYSEGLKKLSVRVRQW